jgi:hypothetical protein
MSPSDGNQRELSPSAGKWIGAFFIALPCVAAFWSTLDSIRFLEIAHHASGVVTQNIYHYGYRTGNTDLYVEFKTEDGKSYTAMCRRSFKGFCSLPQVGDHVDVLYNPDNPMDVNINSFSTLWGNSLFFGLFVVFIGGLWFLAVRKTR